jgi:TPR repeat protein
MNLGTLYLNGVNGVPNYEQALKWLTAAAEQGHANAHANIAVIYYNGLGVEKNTELGFQFFEKSADLGSSSSCFTLAKMLSDKNNPNRDLEKAFYYYLSAANKWHPEGQYEVAAAYFNGDGITVNYPEAVKWLVLAEKAGVGDAPQMREHFESNIDPNEFQKGVELAKKILEKAID